LSYVDCFNLDLDLEGGLTGIKCREPDWSGLEREEEASTLTASGEGAAVRVSQYVKGEGEGSGGKLHVSIAALDPNFKDPHPSTVGSAASGAFEALFGKHCQALGGPMIKCMQSRMQRVGRNPVIKELPTCSVIRMANNCKEAEARFYPCAEPSRGGVTQRLRRENGRECVAGEAKVCQGLYGTGVQPCVFGVYSHTCQMSLCHSGNEFIWDDSTSQYECKPSQGQDQDPRSPAHQMEDCSMESPFWCPQKGECVKTLQMCTAASLTTASTTIRAASPSPPEGSKYICPDGSAKDALESCGEHETSLAACDGAKPVFCESQGGCVTDLHACYPQVQDL